MQQAICKKDQQWCNCDTVAWYIARYVSIMVSELWQCFWYPWIPAEAQHPPCRYGKWEFCLSFTTHDTAMSGMTRLVWRLCLWQTSNNKHSTPWVTLFFCQKLCYRIPTTQHTTGCSITRVIHIIIAIYSNSVSLREDACVYPIIHLFTDLQVYLSCARTMIDSDYYLAGEKLPNGR